MIRNNDRLLRVLRRHKIKIQGLSLYSGYGRGALYNQLRDKRVRDNFKHSLICLLAEKKGIKLGEIVGEPDLDELE